MLRDGQGDAGDVDLLKAVRADLQRDIVTAQELAEYTNKENLITWILGFGYKAELAEPIEIWEEIMQIIANMRNIYAS